MQPELRAVLKDAILGAIEAIPDNVPLCAGCNDSIGDERKRVAALVLAQMEDEAREEPESPLAVLVAAMEPGVPSEDREAVCAMIEKAANALYTIGWGEERIALLRRACRMLATDGTSLQGLARWFRSVGAVDPAVVLENAAAALRESEALRKELEDAHSEAFDLRAERDQWKEHTEALRRRVGELEGELRHVDAYLAHLGNSEDTTERRAIHEALYPTDPAQEGGAS
jgi:hypothetical protein